MHDHILEPAAQEIADATSEPPFLYELEQAAVHVLRKALGTR